MLTANKKAFIETSRIMFDHVFGHRGWACGHNALLTGVGTGGESQGHSGSPVASLLGRIVTPANEGKMIFILRM